MEQKKAKKRKRKRRMIGEDRKEIEQIDVMTKGIDGGRTKTLV